MRRLEASGTIGITAAARSRADRTHHARGQKASQSAQPLPRIGWHDHQRAEGPRHDRQAGALADVHSRRSHRDIGDDQRRLEHHQADPYSLHLGIGSIRHRPCQCLLCHRCLQSWAATRRSPVLAQCALRGPAGLPRARRSGPAPPSSRGSDGSLSVLPWRSCSARLPIVVRGPKTRQLQACSLGSVSVFCQESPQPYFRRSPIWSLDPS